MLILPVGLDKNEVRRVPWVTATLIAVCVLVQLVLAVGFSGAEREADEGLSEAFQFLGERPYLSAPPEIAPLLGQDGRARLEEMRAEWERSAPPVPPAIAARQQEQLDALAEEATSRLRRLPEFRLGFIPADPGLLTILTYAFLHGGWLHLLGNMLFLFLSGPFIEDVYGRWLFSALYAGSAVLGAGSFAIAVPHSAIPLVGASGAIAGVMGAFLWRLGTRRIHFLVLPVVFIPAFRFNLRLPAFVVLPFWALEQVYFASTVNEDSGVAFAAHVGGFLTGLLFAMVMTLFRVEERIIAPAIEQEISLEQNPDIERASDARVAGDLAMARRTIQGVLQSEPRNLDAWIESWEIALASEDAEEAGRTGLRLLDLLKRQREDELLWDVAGDSRWRQLPMPSRFLLTVAALYDGSGDGREAIEIYRRVASQSAPDDVAGLRALVSEGEILARAGDLQSAQKTFERARGHSACSEPWRERMASALGPSRPRPGARHPPRE
jgi:membrane associated rhomboid family serine protease